MKEKVLRINSKKEYDEIQNRLLSKGYKWIDGTDEYYDLFEAAKHFFVINIVIHNENKTFEWRHS